DTKDPKGVEVALRLIEGADALIDPFRPGVMERLGIGPDACFARNPKLIYGRMTGWGQDGPMAPAAGHDINYIALSGALYHFGEEGRGPVPPLNLVGDFGGGGLFLAYGMVCALLEAKESGKGQVVDAAMVEGAATLMTGAYGYRRAGVVRDRRGTNVIDGGAHFYNCYETKDGGHVTVGAIEPKFYSLLLDALGLADADLPDQNDQAQWPAMKARFAEIFKTRTRDEWCAVMEGTDICFAPVLSMGEAPSHPHNVARESFVEVAGFAQPAPGPKFSRTKPATPAAPHEIGADTDAVLAEWGFAGDEIAALKSARVVGWHGDR
ncbi:MAG: CoA transferase, partial [Alphaproteobacteria bacterium]|nr:CoA transferase [Alphaproteobacteria bacterium]